MGLLPAVLAVGGSAVLGRGKLLEAGCLDRVELLVLPAMSHHFVRVRADKFTLQAVEMRRLVLRRPCNTRR